MGSTYCSPTVLNSGKSLLWAPGDQHPMSESPCVRLFQKDISAAQNWWATSLLVCLAFWHFLNQNREDCPEKHLIENGSISLKDLTNPFKLGPPKFLCIFVKRLSGWQQPCSPITYLLSPSTPYQSKAFLSTSLLLCIPLYLKNSKGIFKAGPSDNQNVKSGLLSLIGTWLPYEWGCTLQLPAQAAYQLHDPDVLMATE